MYMKNNKPTFLWIDVFATIVKNGRESSQARESSPTSWVRSSSSLRCWKWWSSLLVTLLEVVDPVVVPHLAQKGENQSIKTRKKPKRAHPLTCISGFMTRN